MGWPQVWIAMEIEGLAAPGIYLGRLAPMGTSADAPPLAVRPVTITQRAAAALILCPSAPPRNTGNSACAGRGPGAAAP